MFNTLDEFLPAVFYELRVLILFKDLFDDETFNLPLDDEEDLEEFEIPQFKEFINWRVPFLLTLNLLKEVVQIKVQVNEPFEMHWNQRVHLLHSFQKFIRPQQLFLHFGLGFLDFLFIQLLFLLVLVNYEGKQWEKLVGLCDGIGFFNLFYFVVESDFDLEELG